ncbi:MULTISPECIES: mannose-1-phosphate guanylyltransferase/mannose-6-phosphate isomerase [Candidatus Accumulibacter]|jgi:mannose-1-phosphate guanylyltransferase/mannose-6-phosphate isomerase|uniref:mannose-1-phosphate guanylyltransferase/mannose-6-phosphate isomerase n=1 Tax=Candidatus Accumulibacter TaxID=327159 RepID=UPI001AC8F492|nr:mannose-1-phosphate guanylyltransferase/mannose-6-phosphate isomerase [Accumulibacter sp.]MBN8448994.1 mannose-1-phosphate guanylyltransferase/mannose-6-phosphate isomerase [Candidatus Accumulibacter necessarius]MBN8495921.1 mannose-1-phosphate guanylyltransferase/mannose-6-phosphate isomerase [Accumulibacter sp.]
MDSPVIRPVILCGGSGTRLWPLSRTHYPKQFLRLVDDFSLLQNTLKRLDGLVGLGKTIAVANENHRFLVAEQFLEIGLQADILLEPAARNTAPAVAAAALQAIGDQREQAVPLLLVLPSDHVIADVAAFQDAVRAAVPHALAGALVTFGVLPDRPETGYGYIRRGDPLAGGYALDRFVEKPDPETARAYVDSGEYFWNSGMFLFRADTYLEALERFAPGIRDCVAKAVATARRDLDFLRLDPVAFAASPSNSIDYAVMEKTESGVVIPLAAGWNDIGAWDALASIGQADGNGNTQRGDVLSVDSRNSVLVSEGRLLATVGISELIVIATPDAVLVADKAKAQEVKTLVDELKRSARCETEFRHIVHRPWGSYEGLAHGPRYQVKRILVKPGASLSLQKHHHRAEHWVVVKGTAVIVRGDQSLLLSENESTYIPLGVVHRLENPGKIDLEIVEVQSGSYLGEDDIVRLDDSYGR